MQEFPGQKQSAEYIKISENLFLQVLSRTESYIKSFRNSIDSDFNLHAELKITHIQNVCNEINLIAGSAGLQKNELAFPHIIALLHDVGRFPQYKLYRTFSDAASVDHSEIGLQVIEEYNLLAGMDPEIKSIVFRCIRNHNRPAVPENENPQTDFYSRLLRDADKLDIWRVVIETNIFHKIEEEPLTGKYAVPEKLIEKFAEQSVVTLDQVSSLYDSFIFRLSWIFDLNFRYSLQEVMNRNYLDRLMAKLPASEGLNRIKDYISLYLDKFNVSKGP